jgi:hypothetical protein
MNQLTKFAQSPQGKKLVNKAQQIANDPKTKEQVEKAKVKLAELRESAASKGNGGAKAGGEPKADNGAAQAKPDDAAQAKPDDAAQAKADDTPPEATPPAA